MLLFSLYVVFTAFFTVLLLWNYESMISCLHGFRLHGFWFGLSPNHVNKSCNKRIHVLKITSCCYFFGFRGNYVRGWYCLYNFKLRFEDFSSSAYKSCMHIKHDVRKLIKFLSSNFWLLISESDPISRSSI